MHKNAKGFTLLELLVGIGIVSILLSVGVPSFTSVIRNSRQVSSANELLTTLNYARDIAITRNTRVTICASASGEDCDAAGDWSRGWIAFVDANGNGAIDGTETVDRAVVGLDIVSLSSAEFPGFLIYRPNGRIMVDDVRDNTGEFILCDQRGAQHARVISVEVSGRPRVSRQTLAGADPACPA